MIVEVALMIGHRELALKITEWQSHEEKDQEGKERPKSRRQKKQANDHFHENGDIYEVDPNLLYNENNLNELQLA